MTAAVMRGQDLIGLPVVGIDTGDDLAEIKDVIFDAGRGAIQGFTLRKRGFLGRKLKDVLPIDGIASVGTHAVMVETADALTHPDGVGDDVFTTDHSPVVNDSVITESGRTLGAVRDVIILGGPHPAVVGFEIGGGSVGDGFVPVAAQRGLSGSALIVPDSYEQRVRTDLTGFAAELVTIERA